MWKDLNITEARNLAMSMSNYSYILHWDGDMIAFSSGANILGNLTEMIKNEQKFRKYYYEIFFTVLRMGYSLNKVTDKDSRFHREAWLYSNSAKMRWESKPLPFSKGDKRIDQPIFPLYYRKLVINKIYGLHLHLIQPPDKLKKKVLYNYWTNPEIKKKFRNYEEFYETYMNKISNDDIFAIKEFDLDGIQITDILNKYREMSYYDIIKAKASEYPWILEEDNLY